MTAELKLQSTRRSAGLLSIPALPVVLGVLIVGRLLQLRDGATPDEGGFLVIAGQWHAGGSSLYGNYWVDRPPLLLVVYRIADLLGGLTALRVIGTVAAVATVTLLASTARQAFGRRAATRSAMVAAALLLTPLFGAADVNGELLAAPFIALGFRAAVEVFHTEDALRSRGAAVLAGASAAAALLVKQNMADVVVFAAVAWVVAWRTHRLAGRDLVDRALLAAAGFTSGYAVVMLWAMAHGSSPVEIYQATYPFRISAARVIADLGSSATGIRLGRLVDGFVWSGVPLLLVIFVAVGVRRSRQPAIVVAIVAVLVFDAFSVLAGGSYWAHYLIQGVPAVVLAAGAASLARPRLLRAATAAVVASSLLSAGEFVLHPPTTPGATIGSALAGAARPGDTLFSAFGDANVVQTSGLSSPYPYLWSLPARVLDPDLAELRGVLAGPRPPTWVVVRGPATVERLELGGAQALIRDRYRVVSQICGRTVYLLRGRHRAVPTTERRCGAAPALPYRVLPWP